MRITVNGTGREVADSLTIEELLGALELPANGPGIAVAHNNAVVPRGQWREVRLEEDDTIEIIHAVQGG